MLAHKVDRIIRPAAEYLQQGHMARLGIRNTTRLAKLYNGVFRGHYHRYRVRQYRLHFQELLDENGWSGGPVNVMKDGWALDTSGALPHLDRLLADADEVIAERGGRCPTDDRYRAFFRNLIKPEDLLRWPSFLDFICSSEMLATVSHYMGFVPCLSRTLPTGVRFVESYKKFDALGDHPPRDSQLFHIDPYCRPMVYVLVALRDIALEHGPFCYLPASTSQHVSRTLRYWSRGRPYRLSDEEVYSVVHPSEVRRFCCPRGTVLFIDTSRCFHYGSRDSILPRYQLFVGFVSPVRTDFSETCMQPDRYAPQPGDNRLRRMVLDMYCRAGPDGYGTASASGRS
jgi:hypothetical protein